MEYSVLDLIKCLLKKWFLILLAMGIAGAAAVGLSQASYEKAVAQYEEFTSETVPMPEGYGTAAALLRYGIADTSEETLISVIRALPFEGGAPRFTAEELEEAVLDAVGQQITGLYSGAALRENLQTAFAETSEQTELLVSEHMWTEPGKDNCFRVYVSGLDEATSRQILALFKAEFAKLADGLLLDIELTEESYGFTPGEGIYTDQAEFSQLVMQEPAAPPNPVRNAITGAVFGFALACILILVLTFVRDSAGKENEK